MIAGKSAKRMREMRARGMGRQENARVLYLITTDSPTLVSEAHRRLGTTSKDKAFSLPVKQAVE